MEAKLSGTSAAAPPDNPELSLRAVGAWTRLVRMADPGTMCVRSALTRMRETNVKDGHQAIRSAFKELERNGYLVCETERAIDGRITGYNWHLILEPQMSSGIAA